MQNNNSKEHASIGVVGAAIDKGQPKEGIQKAPDVLRQHGLNTYLQEIGVRLNDYGNISQFEPRNNDRIMNCLNMNAFIDSSWKIADVVEKSVAENDLTLVLGGDHSLAYGSIVGHFRAFPNSFVVWVDAHADINTPCRSSSGNIHGMPVSFLIKETNYKIPKSQGLDKLVSCMDSTNCLYIGLRDVDTPEWEYLKEFNIKYFTMDDIREIGLEKVLQITVQHINMQANCKVHISFDIDVLDPKFAPSTGTPVPGGLTLDEGKLICETIAKTGKLRSVDLAEVNPELGNSQDSRNTVHCGVEILKSCIPF